MRYLLLIGLFFVGSLLALAQTNPPEQAFVIKKDHIIDHEHIFTAQERGYLDSIITDCWKKGITQIAIVTLDDRHTDPENFDNYVIQQLTAHALGEYGKNNGIVIALSKKFRQMRIQNGHGIQRVLSDADTKKIIDERFIPAFKAGHYFEGTVNGLKTIIRHVEETRSATDFSDASAIFRPSIFKKIRAFVLENGTRQTFRALDSNNPSYQFTSLDVFLGPSKANTAAPGDMSADDYYELIIRNNDGHHYHFVYVEKPTTERRFIHEAMLPDKVYWWHSGDKYLSSDVWPLLDQIEDELTQKAGSDDPTQLP